MVGTVSAVNLRKAQSLSSNNTTKLSDVIHQLNLLSKEEISEQKASIPLFLQTLIIDGVKWGASDIHFHPHSSRVSIKFRKDSYLHTIGLISQPVWDALTIHIKVRSGMNIAERHRPQSGSFLNGNVDVRVSAHPTNQGESIVLRLLTSKDFFMDLANIGFDPAFQSSLLSLITKKTGLFIVCGATGSGKSTTLYALLKTLEAPHLSIMTLEQPIEYTIHSFRQTEIRESGPLSFGEGLRSILRQDPDIVLVGETRDKETAQIAFRASLTGHHIFTTLHSNSTEGTIERLIDLGVSPSSIKEGLSGLLFQKLTRILCDHCKKMKTTKTYAPIGCEKCLHTGYQGRALLYELKVPQHTNGTITFRSVGSMKNQALSLLNTGKISKDAYTAITG